MQALKQMPSFKQQEYHVYFKTMNKYININGSINELEEILPKHLTSVTSGERLMTDFSKP